MNASFSLFGIKTTNARVRRGLLIFAHILFWCGFIFLPLLLMQPNNEGPRMPRPNRQMPDNYFEITFFFVNTLSVLLFYLNSEWFIPKFLKKKNGRLYGFLVVVTIAACLLLNYHLRFYLLGHPPRAVFSFSTFYLFLSVFAISACYRLLTDYQREQRLITEREKVRLQSELSFLRSQISPHFMFNLMNSLAALARKKSDLLEPMIVKMSNLLRYMLYDSDDARVPIDREIEYLNSYIDLQKMRFGEHVTIETNFDIQNHDLSLEPMLLIPFVENAFKHGTGYMREPMIRVELQTTAHALNFSVKNKYSDELNEKKDDSSGIGLANVRRRLELLYATTHTLDIHQQNGWFETELLFSDIK
jgi:two-component system, LytTR family, sensor kinase